LLSDTQQIESSLHTSLKEHLNVEIVLNTITNISEAITWLKSTFLYARILKNPKYYGININPPSNGELNSNFESRIDQYLNELSKKNLRALMDVNLIEECDLENSRSQLKATLNGHLMARYCLAFETMKLILVDLGFRYEACEDQVHESAENQMGRVEQDTKSIIELVSNCTNANFIGYLSLQRYIMHFRLT